VAEIIWHAALQRVTLRLGLRPRHRVNVRAMKAAKSRTRTAKSPKPTGRAAAKPALKAVKPGKAGGRAAARTAPKVPTDLSLFDPLSEGERADALRILSEDRRVAQMA
jgi:hypothetical protein